MGLAYQNLASFEASLKRSWWASFRAGSKTFRYHSDLLRRDPSFYDAYLSTGVFHYVVGRLGWNVKWLAFMLGYRGSREEGKRELRICTEKAQLVADDARVILTLIYTREKNLQAAFDEMSVLLKRYPKNYLVHLDMGGIAMLMDRTDVAVTVYETSYGKFKTARTVTTDWNRRSCTIGSALPFVFVRSSSTRPRGFGNLSRTPPLPRFQESLLTSRWGRPTTEWGAGNKHYTTTNLSSN